MIMGILVAREARTIKKFLKYFMDASEMAINHLMSQIFFINTPLAIQFHVFYVLGFS
jgi:hypothetical protein